MGRKSINGLNIRFSVLGLVSILATYLLSCNETSLDPAINNHSYSNLQDVQCKHLHWRANVNFDKKIIQADAQWLFKNINHSKELRLDINGLKIDSVTLNLRPGKFTIGHSKKGLGEALVIPIEHGDSLVHIYYSTAPNAQALQWLTPAQTAGKKMPYLFTQCESVNARSIIPCQDNPANRITYSAEIQVPQGMMALMSAENPQKKNASGLYQFKMDIPIPTYLIALAVGDIEFRKIDNRSGVYGEPVIVDQAAQELNDIPKMIAAAEKIAGPYAWGRYDVLIQPPSFPIGGMENPKLTFATPTILAGDKSLVSLIAHELAHSWSGNTVTNASWSDLWLNEGFTTYFERRIMEELTDTSYVDMLWELSYQDLQMDLKDFGDTSALTKLKLELDDKDPEDAFSNIPYEKGAHFLWLVERTVGRNTFDSFLLAYFKDNAYKPMTTDMALAYMDKHLFSKNADWKKQIGVQQWVFESGLPKNCPRPHQQRFKAVDQIREQYLSTQKIDESATKQWTTHEWLQFLRKLPTEMPTSQLQGLDNIFHFTNTKNSEIAFEWFMHTISSKYKNSEPQIEQFLSRVGRKKFVRPLYLQLYKYEPTKATMWFDKYKQNYHPETKDAVASIFTKKN